MRTRPVLSSIFAAVAFVVIGWQFDLAANAHSPGLATNTATDTGSGTVASPPPSVSPSADPAASPTPDPTDTASAPSAPPASDAPAAPTPAPPAPPKPAPAAPAPVSGSFTGQSISTQYGVVQVQVVVTAGKITDVRALHLTDYGGRSVQISNSAAPTLRSEVISSQSARVASVSGATYTSDGYLSSVQSALDQAHI